jgi:hypothetical protein
MGTVALVAVGNGVADDAVYAYMRFIMIKYYSKRTLRSFHQMENLEERCLFADMGNMVIKEQMEVVVTEW